MWVGIPESKGEEIVEMVFWKESLLLFWEDVTRPRNIKGGRFQILGRRK